MGLKFLQKVLVIIIMQRTWKNVRAPLPWRARARGPAVRPPVAKHPPTAVPGMAIFCAFDTSSIGPLQFRVLKAVLTSQFPPRFCPLCNFLNGLLLLLLLLTLLYLWRSILHLAAPLLLRVLWSWAPIHDVIMIRRLVRVRLRSSFWAEEEQKSGHDDCKCGDASDDTACYCSSFVRW